VYVAYYLHWSHAEILDLDHTTRSKVIAGIARIHTELDHTAPSDSWR
jgi:hypothetical protein